MIPTISIFLEDILAMKLLRNVYTINEIPQKCGIVQDPVLRNVLSHLAGPLAT